MKKQGLLMVLFMLVAVTAWAKGKVVVWENPTTELFAADTYLKVGEQRYTVVSADNAKLGEKLYTQDGKLDMAFHFCLEVGGRS